jgi:soluble lytic murein transglycosylase
MRYLILIAAPLLTAAPLLLAGCGREAPLSDAELALAIEMPEAQQGRLRGVDVDDAPSHLAGDTVAVRSATAEVRAGLARATAGDAAGAVAAYTRAAELVPAFGPWARALSASAAARGGDTASVRRHLAATDPDIARSWGWRARVDAALAARDSAGAARIAAAAAAEMPDTARRVQAWARAGALHAAAGRHAEAAVMLRRAIDESVAPAAALEAARLLGTLRVVTADDRRRIGRVYLRHRNMDRATAAYDAYMAAAQPPAALRATIQLELGRGLFDSRDYAAAERRLRLALNAGGSRETSAEAAFTLGRSLYRQGRNADARAAFLKVTQDYPGTTAAGRAHFMVADIDHDAGRVDGAKTHYRAAVLANGVDAALSAARLGSFALLENRPREAATIFGDAYRRASGRARQQPGYWWAHALETAGAADSARAVFAEVRTIDPFSYYGLRSGERVRAGKWDFGPTLRTHVTAQERGGIVGRLDVLDMLRAVELSDAAALESARIISRFSSVDGALYTLGAAYHERGQTFNGISLGRELLRRQDGVWSREVLQLVYPFPYREDVMRHARANGLDPYLVAGLIRQESMFNTRARSPVGALGLMQVMPATGTAVARGLGISGFQPSRLTDPTINLRIGTKYLADQIRSHNGRMVDAIAAYNAGPHRVTGWKRFPEYRDPEIFIERIPYEETRNYVKIVQANAHIYRELYGDD